MNTRTIFGMIMMMFIFLPVVFAGENDMTAFGNTTTETAWIGGATGNLTILGNASIQSKSNGYPLTVSSDNGNLFRVYDSVSRHGRIYIYNSTEDTNIRLATDVDCYIKKQLGLGGITSPNDPLDVEGNVGITGDIELTAASSITGYYGGACSYAINDIADNGDFTCQQETIDAWTNDSTTVYTSKNVNISGDANLTGDFSIYNNTYGEILSFNTSNGYFILGDRSKVTTQRNIVVVGDNADWECVDSSGTRNFGLFSTPNNEGSLILSDGSGNTNVSITADVGIDSYINNGGQFGVGIIPTEPFHFYTDTETADLVIESATQNAFLTLKVTDVTAAKQPAIIYSNGTSLWSQYMDLDADGSLRWYAYTTGGLRMRLNNTGSLFLSEDLSITGTLSKGAGTFTIDHPLDPTNKILQHSFVESPEMRNTYYGQAETILNKVTIKLPDWWQALNGYNQSEYTYQFTPIGKWCNLWVSKEITNNEFEISSDSDCRLSWTISGIRHDAYAEANRVEVELDKEPENLIIEYQEEEITEDNITKTYMIPEMPSVSSRRKGACIHGSACKGVKESELIRMPNEPKRKLLKAKINDREYSFDELKKDDKLSYLTIEEEKFIKPITPTKTITQDPIIPEPDPFNPIPVGAGAIITALLGGGYIIYKKRDTDPSPNYKTKGEPLLLMYGDRLSSTGKTCYPNKEDNKGRKYNQYGWELIQ